jgi:NADP-dependent 3-hydroxy acid dehydrogenase YdfG
MKNIIVITGAASGFGAYTYRRTHEHWSRSDKDDRQSRC